MKKTTLISFIVVVSAMIGALTAMFVYLRKREEELDEYEQILFDAELMANEAEQAEMAQNEIVEGP